MPEFPESRPPTHQAIPFAQIFSLSDVMKTALKKQKARTLTNDFLKTFSQEHSIPLPECYVIATYTQKPFPREHALSFTVCVGECQKWGAVECIGHLLDLQTEREQAGKEGFDILCSGCQSRCSEAPIIRIEIEGQVTGLSQVDRPALEALLKQLDAHL